MLDYKAKYLNLRMKLIEATDVAYRLGYEQGMEKGKTQSVMQQQQQIDPNTGLPIQNPNIDPNAVDQNTVQPQGSNANPNTDPSNLPTEMNNMDYENGDALDQGINQLESLVQKGEKPSVTAMRQAVEQLAELRKSQKEKIKKKDQKLVSSQKKLVDGLLSKWADEAKKVEEDVGTTITFETSKK